MLTNLPKGTKDILPGEVYKWHYVEERFREACERYCFSEIRTPTFEHTELFLRGIGETTDVVQKEMYSFKDHGDRSITLKPEGTSPAVRAFIEHKLYADVQPTKLYYITPCFRYEKPQAGRLREFHQFGIETFGTSDMLADAEIIGFAADFLESLGVKDLELHINSIGCPNCRERYKKALKDFLAPVYDKLCDSCKSRYEKNPMRILDCKSPIDQELVKGAPRMLDYLCDDCRTAFRELQTELDNMGIEYSVDPGIVRGLDYYTKTAFEFVSNKIGAQGTVCGGGRYDNLIEEIGGPPTPGVGFGLGIERLLLVMDESSAVIPPAPSVDVFVAYMGDEAKRYAARLVKELRAAGLKTETDTLSRSIKKQFKYADKLHAAKTLIIGENELREGVLSLKDMESGEQRTIKLEDVKKELCDGCL